MSENEERIEKAIYCRADMDQGFAIAYALLQCAQELHSINDSLSAIAYHLERMTPEK